MLFRSVAGSVTLLCSPAGLHSIHILFSQIVLFIADRDEFFQLLVFAPKHIIEMWRFITYIFLHTNYTHLLLNVLIQVRNASSL